MNTIQIEDLIPFYPNQDEIHFQTLISGMKEFSSLASYSGEEIPARGEGFNHQKFVERFMLAYDRLYAFHKTGTGKTLTSIFSAEFSKRKLVSNLVDLMSTSIYTTIEKTLILVKGEIIGQQFKKEIICKGSPEGVYETKELRDIKDLKTQKAKATHILKPHYEIDQYGAFANKLEKMSNEDIREEYSNHFIIFDEIQSLRNSLKDPNKGSRKDKERDYISKYKQLYRLVKHAKNIKVLVLSATPMINNTEELAFIMNLLYPNAVKKMPVGEDFSSDNWNVNRMEKYLRGRVSAVKEFDTGAIKQFEGTQIPGTMEILALSPMIDIQSETYDSLGDSRINFSTAHRQASTFVYPNGEYTNKGFDEYIKITSSGKYIAKPSLLKYISNREGEYNLSQLSTKYQKIIDVSKENINDNSFIYTDYLRGPGAIVLGLCLEAQGYTKCETTENVFENKKGDNVESYCQNSVNTDDLQIKEKFRKLMTYAIISGETSKAVQENIQNVYNSYQNRHGEIIQILIGTRKIREGLNLFNVRNVHTVNGGWNFASIYQGESRAFRASSHVHLIGEKQDELIGYNNEKGKAHDIITQIIEEISRNSSKQLNIREKYLKANVAYEQMSRIQSEENQSFLDFSQLREVFVLIQKTNLEVKIKNTLARLINRMLKIQSDITQNMNIEENKILLKSLLGESSNIISGIMSKISNSMIKNKIRKIMNKGNVKMTASSVFEKTQLRKTIKTNYRKIIEYLQKRSNILSDDVKRLLIQYESVNPDKATVEVNVYRHASVYDNRDSMNRLILTGEDSSLNTIDIELYNYARKDAKNIAKVERYIKEIAVDAQIHKNRNMITDEGRNGSPECDYQLCKYETVDPEPLTVYRRHNGKWEILFKRAIIYKKKFMYFNGYKWIEFKNTKGKTYKSEKLINKGEEGDILFVSGQKAIDSSNYNIIYSDKEFETFKTLLSEKLRRDGKTNFDELYELYPQFDKQFIIRSIIKIVDNRTVVYNRYNIINYVYSEGDVIFISETYPHIPFKDENQIGKEYYTNILYGIEKSSLKEILKTNNENRYQNILREFVTGKIPFEEIENLDAVARASLLEKAIEYKYTRNPNRNVNKILDRLQNQYYTFTRPEMGINVLEMVRRKKTSGRGRKPDMTKELKVKRLERDGDFIEYANINKSETVYYISSKEGKIYYTSTDDETIEKETNKEQVVIHNVYSIKEGDTNTGAISRLIKGEGLLRIYSVKDNTWKNVLREENMIYTALLQLEIEKKFSEFYDLGVYGLMTIGNTFRVVDHNNDIYDSTKQLCNSIVGGPNKILEMMKKINLDYTDESLPNDLDDTISLYRKPKNIKDKMIYYKMITENGDNKFCSFIYKAFMKKEKETGRKYIIWF